MKQNLAEYFTFGTGNVLHVGLAGDQVTEVDMLPANGVATVNIACWVYLDHASDLTVNFSTADDAAGTNSTTLTANVPIWIDGVKQTDAKALTFLSTLTADVYHSAVAQIPAVLVPTGKYVGCYLTAGNATNLFTAIAFEDTYYKG